MSQMPATAQAQLWALDKAGLKWADRDNWSDKDRTDYLAAIAEFRRKNPLLFTPAEQAATENYASAAATPAPQFSYVSEFFKEAGTQVSNLNDDLNPFAEANRNTTRNVVIGAILLAVAVFSTVWAVRTSPRNPAT